MGGDVDEVAGFKVTRLGFIGEAQPCLALDQQHPFAFGLVVPETFRAALAGGDDAFDAQPRSRE